MQKGALIDYDLLKHRDDTLTNLVIIIGQMHVLCSLIKVKFYMLDSDTWKQ